MAAISTLRGTLATALTNNGVWSTFAFPPATLLANSVVITPASDYIVPSNNSQTSIAPLANFKILITFLGLMAIHLFNLPKYTQTIHSIEFFHTAKHQAKTLKKMITLWYPQSEKQL